MGSTSPDISVVVNAHSEGRLAHRSLRSALRAADYARGQGVAVEFVAVLDDPSAETLAYFDERAGLFDAVGRVEFRDPGLSRNRGAELSSGRYLAFLNADDLFSENWLAAAFRSAADDAGSKLVLHPEFNLFFGAELFLSSSINSDSPGYSPLELIEFNPWTALNFVPRDFFLDGNQYAATKGTGFGREGWHWNCEAIADGAVHRIVPGTVHFVRLKPGGLSSRAARTGTTFPPSKLFDDPARADGTGGPPGAPGAETNAAGGPHALHGSNGGAPFGDEGTKDEGTPSVKARLGRQLRRPLSSVLQSLRGAAIKVAAPRPDVLDFCLDVNRAARKFLTSPRRKPLDEWLVAEWRRIHQIEPELFPSGSVVKELERRPVPRSSVARHYPELSELVGPAPTHVYLLPWLKRGGADIEALHFMNAAVVENPSNRVVCVTTEDVDSEWLSLLPEGIRVVELGKVLRGFSKDERALVLLRLLIQKRPRVIHNVNSGLGYKVYDEHGPALTAHSRLYASIFALEPNADGSVGGYGVWDLPLCIDYLSGAFTDSSWFAGWLCDLFGFDREKFSVLYVPAPRAAESPRLNPVGGELNILWASRFDVEKRPDVLYRIASESVGLSAHFHVYGTPVYSPSTAEFMTKLKELPNVTTYGAYDKFESIPTGDYDLFLYTSERDGLPNVLLEAVAAGLPVIAPDVGGIKEVINDSTGFLVSGAEAVDEYVGYVRRILGDYRIVAPKVEAARALIESRQSWDSFVSGLRRVPGYFTA